MLTNLKVSWIFQEIADLLEIKGENYFKIKAYRQAARNIENLDIDLKELVTNRQLNKVGGIGKNLAEKIKEIVATDHCTYLELLRREISPNLINLLVIPGLGPKTIHIIYHHLGIDTLEALATAAKQKKIRELPGLGSKTELNILKGIDLIQMHTGKIPLSMALAIANRFLQPLKALPCVKETSLAGPIRRGEEMINEIVILVATSEPEQVLSILSKYPLIKNNPVLKGCSLETTLISGVKLQILAVDPATYGVHLITATGSPTHYQRLQQIAQQQGMHLDILCGLANLSEQEIYAQLNLPWIAPELREDQGEIEAAQAENLPQLISPDAIKGDLHLHSHWSDGVNSIAEIVNAARQRGYQYLAITDHSHSLKVARGLSVAKLAQQQEEIQSLKKTFSDIHLLQGIEVDILADGRLDYPDAVLQQMDFVIASIHTGLKQDALKITARLENALKNPYVDLIGHPTGRLLGRRPAYDLHWEQVMQLAAKTGTMLEINCGSDRLDLSAAQARLAKTYGIKIVINTDAHEVSHLGDIQFGVITARRGWLENGDVFNTMSAAKLNKWLSRRAHRREKN